MHTGREGHSCSGGPCQQGAGEGPGEIPRGGGDAGAPLSERRERLPFLVTESPQKRKFGGGGQRG